MAFNDIENARIKRDLKNYLEKIRPPVAMRHQVDLGFRIEKYSVVIFQIRPSFKDPQEKIEFPVAKTTYVNSKGLWKIFWQRRDLKWHSYEPVATVKTFPEFLQVIEEDEYSCFWG